MSAPTVPAQWQKALKIANTVRANGRAIKQNIAGLPQQDGLLAVADLITADPSPAGAIEIGQLLNAIQRISNYTSEPLLCRAGIYRHSRRVRELTPRQRTVLVRLLRERADR